MGLGRGDKEGHVARRWVNGQVLWRPLYRRWLLFWDKRIWNILNRVAWSMSKYVFAAFWHGKFGAFFVLIRRRQWHPTPVLLLGKSHGRRSLVGWNPWGRQELDTTSLSLSLSCIGEGNGSPLQCSCLENPREGSLVGCRLWGLTESDTTEVT